MRDIRKHVAWYLHGFPAGAELRRALALVKTLSELDDLLDQLDPTCRSRRPPTGPRGRQGSPASVALPEGWLTDPDDCTVPTGRRRDAFRWVNRDHLDITSLRISQYDMSLVVCGSRRGATDIAASIRAAAQRLMRTGAHAAHTVGGQ